MNETTKIRITMEVTYLLLLAGGLVSFRLSDEGMLRVIDVVLQYWLN